MKILYKIVLLLSFTIAGISSATAQLNPLSAQYFTNQYLINPAFAGASQGIRINGAYRKLWNNVPGSPLTQNVTADYGFNKVGIGIAANSESAGLQRQVRVVGSYAYHLQLDERGDQLLLGMSLGFLSQRLENTDLYGNPNDPLVGLYNNRKTYLDGDMGVAYTSGNLNVEGSIPNLKSVFKKDVIKLADVATFYTAVSYKIRMGDGMDAVDMEPKAAYRGVQGYGNIWDAGAQAGIADQQVFLTGMYHSTENATFGLGMNFRKKYLVSGSYTTQTSALSSYTNGSFELNLRLNLSK